MVSDNLHKGSCFCGEVQFELSGEPLDMGYCHCESCRRWSGAPVSAFTLWKPDSLKITRGAASIGTFNKTAFTHRKWCKQCGGHLYAEHPTLRLVDVLAPAIPSLHFEPGMHINYQETVLPMRDGKPKLKDMPKEAGGSGVYMTE